MKWLASYPKSGNTWLRFLVYVLTVGKAPDSSGDVDRFANSRPLPDHGELPAYKKTHCTIEALSPRWPRTTAAIYICRHPLDTLCSTLNYDLLTGVVDLSKTSLEERAVWKRDRIDAYLAHAGAPEWIGGERNYGSWIDNVAGWAMQETPFPTLVLRYEDMLADTRSAIVRIAGFLDIELSDDLLVATLEATRFSAMRQMEDSEISAANDGGRPLGRFSGDERRRAAAEGVRFFNNGRSGSYLELLTPEQIARGQDVFGEAASKLGYQF